MADTGKLWPQIFGASGATMGAFSLGTIIAWSNDAHSYIEVNDDSGSCLDSDHLSCLSHSEFRQVSALFNIGAAIVPFLTILLFPMIGKKWTMILLVIPNVVGWVLILFSTKVWMFSLGRVLTGFSGGAFAIAAPAFSNEIAEQRIRGALGTMMQLMICLGILFMLLLADKVNWQIASGVCIAFPALLGIWLFFLPRSPVFLVQKGDYDEARRSLRFYRKKKDIETELAEIQAEVEEQNKVGMVSVQLVTKGVYLKPFLISMSLMAFQQLSGVNFVNGFVKDIFESAGSTIDPYVSALIIGVIQVVSTLVAVLIVDRFGRKLLLIVSGGLMCISHLLLGIFFLLKNTQDEDPATTVAPTTISTTSTVQLFFEKPEAYVSQETVESIGWLPLVSLMLFMGAFNLGFGPLPWVMNVELFASEARVPAAAICGSFNWLVSYIVMLFTGDIKDGTSDQFCYFMFSAICLLGTLFVKIITPETKGKTEEEMRRYFGGGTSAPTPPTQPVMDHVAERKESDAGKESDEVSVQSESSEEEAVKHTDHVNE